MSSLFFERLNSLIDSTSKGRQSNNPEAKHEFIDIPEALEPHQEMTLLRKIPFFPRRGTSVQSSPISRFRRYVGNTGYVARLEHPQVCGNSKVMVILLTMSHLYSSLHFHPLCCFSCIFFLQVIILLLSILCYSRNSKPPVGYYSSLKRKNAHSLITTPKKLTFLS